MKAIELLGLLLSSTPLDEVDEIGEVDREALSTRLASLLRGLGEAAVATGELEGLLDTMLDTAAYAELRMHFARVGQLGPEHDERDVDEARACARSLVSLARRVANPPLLRRAIDDANLFTGVRAVLDDPATPAVLREHLRGALLAALATMVDAAARLDDAPAALAELVVDVAPRWLAWGKGAEKLAVAAASWVRPGLVPVHGYEPVADQALFFAVAGFVDDDPECPSAAILDLHARASELERSHAAAAALRASPRLRTTD